MGPLPSSIYWRRRAVVLCLIALLALLAVWVVNSRGGGGNNGADGDNGHTPASSITPGPSATGPLNSSRPGGSVGGGSGGSGSTSSGGSGDAGTTSSGSGGATASSGTSGTSGTDGGTTSGGTSGGTTSGGSSEQLPAGSTLPDCTSSAVSLTLRSAQNSYDPGKKPQFKLTARNSGGTSCKLDFGPTAAVFTITDVDDNHVWASDDCPVDKSAYLMQVPAGASTTYTVQWGRTTSSPQCATPRGGQAPTGTYLVEAKLPGFAAKQTSFVLKND
ncbi:hypothetical protein ACFXJ5_36030 [Streptomyces sp. NPDC059373]